MNADPTLILSMWLIASAYDATVWPLMATCKSPEQQAEETAVRNEKEVGSTLRTWCIEMSCLTFNLPLDRLVSLQDECACARVCVRGCVCGSAAC